MQVETDKFIMSWAIPNRVIQITYRDNLDRDDLKDLTDGLAQFYEAGTFPVHVISDNRKMDTVDADLKILRDAFTIMRRDGWGWGSTKDSSEKFTIHTSQS